jgi:hypothetical protein
MSEEFASLLVEMLLAVNEGRMMEEVHRTPETSTPTRVEEFLSTALGPMSSPSMARSGGCACGGACA